MPEVRPAVKLDFASGLEVLPPRPMMDAATTEASVVVGRQLGFSGRTSETIVDGRRLKSRGANPPAQPEGHSKRQSDNPYGGEQADPRSMRAIATPQLEISTQLRNCSVYSPRHHSCGLKPCICGVSARV